MAEAGRRSTAVEEVAVSSEGDVDVFRFEECSDGGGEEEDMTCGTDAATHDVDTSSDATGSSGSDHFFLF